jgi:hypothetical protein
MDSSFGYLIRYALIFGQKNVNPFVQIELGGHIISCCIPKTNHSFINGLADMIYHKRKHILPHLNEESDWFLSERLFYNRFAGDGVKLLCIKCVIRAAYCDCLCAGFDLPSICETCLTPTGIPDETFLNLLDNLSDHQLQLLFQKACSVSLSWEQIKRFLRKEITQLYLENEAEILNVK